MIMARRVFVVEDYLETSGMTTSALHSYRDDPQAQAHLHIRIESRFRGGLEVFSGPELHLVDPWFKLGCRL
jgi:hypothetical protein